MNKIAYNTMWKKMELIYNQYFKNCDGLNKLKVTNRKLKGN